MRIVPETTFGFRMMDNPEVRDAVREHVAELGGNPNLDTPIFYTMETAVDFAEGVLRKLIMQPPPNFFTLPHTDAVEAKRELRLQPHEERKVRCNTRFVDDAVVFEKHVDREGYVMLSAQRKHEYQLYSVATVTETREFEGQTVKWFGEVHRCSSWWPSDRPYTILICVKPETRNKIVEE